MNNSLCGHINKVEDLSDVNPSATLGNVERVRRIPRVKWLCFEKLEEKKMKKKNCGHLETFSQEKLAVGLEGKFLLPGSRTRALNDYLE